MHMKRFCAYILVFSIVSLAACNASNLKKIYEANESYGSRELSSYDFTHAMQELPYEKMTSTACDVHQFVDTYCRSQIDGRGSLLEVAHSIGVECLRENAAGLFYSMHKTKQGGRLYVFYRDSRENSIIRWFYVCKSLHYSDFSSIQIGSSIRDVIKIDPSAQLFYNVLVSDEGFQDNVWQSYFDHYLEDGILRYHYDYQLETDDFIVYDIDYFGDYQWIHEGSSVEEYDLSLLPGDWAF